ncbi:MacS family sensor histidine kinase [Streptomyces boninensis]|uniref:MacS family sensor histidine kinase n=1 Tax=Streptomyces boninensis TaxID=2039455 RepID=UPI003B217B37
MRMSVEQPLWQALTWFRVLTLAYAVVGYSTRYDNVERPELGWVYMAALAVWTLATFRKVSSAQACTYRFLAMDVGMALAGIVLTIAVETDQRIGDGASTLPSIWTAGAVLGFAIKGGWRWGASAAAGISIATIVQRKGLAQENIHNIVLLLVAASAIGYIVEVARASERTLARALQIEAATRERERLARDIHDSVLQVLSMVQRRGTALGGEAAELGQLAGEQEIALRALVTSGPEPDVVPAARRARSRRMSRAVRAGARGDAGGADAGALSVGTETIAADTETADADLRTLVSPYASARVTVSDPGAPVLLPRHAALELAAAVGAALDNVDRHAGADARAWILVEDAPDAVLVTVRDDGPGIPEGRLAAAEAEGRLGVAQSIRGRLADLGGTAELVSPPGQGTEVELRVPR